MKTSTRLNSVIFQLTPTRTRFDLIIIANDSKEKIASGLLNPFLAHLITAQNQIEKGGYSILLQPEPTSDAAWFTKGTVERFVRFVNTPEILERVYTIESEILQIKEAIIVHKGIDDDVRRQGENHQANSIKGGEGCKTILAPKGEKAEHNTHFSDINDNITEETNSKVQLLRTLDTRKLALQNEQSMAFARAVAAGFDIDHTKALVSFAECFGASRLRIASLRFMELWKNKHENRRWLQIEAVPTPLAMPSSASGITLSSVTDRCDISSSDAASKSNVEATIETRTSEKPLENRELRVVQQLLFQGQCLYPTFPPWFSQPLPGHETRQGRHSVCVKGVGKPESEIHGMDPCINSLNLEIEISESNEPRKNFGGSHRKHRVMLCPNYNCTTREKKYLNNESKLSSDSGTDTNGEEPDATGTTHKSTLKSSRRKGSFKNPVDELISCEMEECNYEKERDAGHWQIFQNLLLRITDDDNSAANSAKFSRENVVQSQIGGNIDRDDPADFQEQEIYLNGNSLHPKSDESFMIPFRLMKQTRVHDRTSVNMDTELASTQQKPRNICNRKIGQVNCVPDDLILMPERGTEKRTSEHDHDNYKMQVCIGHATSTERRTRVVGTDAKKGSSMSDKKMSRLSQDSLDRKKNGGVLRKGKPAILTAANDARARAEKIRAFKADLQKVKKEKEEAEQKRLEDLKRERQKRIVARRNSTPSQPSLPSLQHRKQVEAKLSLPSQRGSKFSDSEPGLSSPLQRSKARASSLGSVDSKRVSTNPISGQAVISSVNRLSRLTPSSDQKKEKSDVFPVSKIAKERIRRLSDSSANSNHFVPSLKRQDSGSASRTFIADAVKTKASKSDEPEWKKIYAIVGKDATPDPKMKTSEPFSDFDRVEFVTKDLVQVNDKPSAAVEYSKTKMADGKMLYKSEMDDHLVIEKNIVTLECENPSTRVVDSSRVKMECRKNPSNCHEMGDTIEVIRDYKSICSPSSALNGADNNPRLAYINRSSSEIVANYGEQKSSKSSKINITGRRCHLPRFQVSSSVLQMPYLEKYSRNLGKAGIKEYSQEFKRLLKFGKRNLDHAVAKTNNTIVNVSKQGTSVRNLATTEVTTLKKLISQEQTSEGDAKSRKSSRYVSILSSLQRKTGRKRNVA